jgi:hypothetical protein
MRATTSGDQLYDFAIQARTLYIDRVSSAILTEKNTKEPPGTGAQTTVDAASPDCRFLACAGLSTNTKPCYLGY